MPVTPLPNSQASAEELEPEVYVDFELRSGVFHIVIGNASPIPAHAVRISFKPGIRWADKKKLFSRLKIFQQLEFLAPGRKFVGVVDDLPSFFRFNRAPKFLVQIQYQNSSGRTFNRKIIHDLAIYSDWPAPLDGTG